MAISLCAQVGWRCAVRTSPAARWASWTGNLPTIQKRRSSVADVIVAQLSGNFPGSKLPHSVFSRTSPHDAGYGVPEWIDTAAGRRPGALVLEDAEPRRVIWRWTTVFRSGDSGFVPPKLSGLSSDPKAVIQLECRTRLLSRFNAQVVWTRQHLPPRNSVINFDGFGAAVGALSRAPQPRYRKAQARPTLHVRCIAFRQGRMQAAGGCR